MGEFQLPGGPCDCSLVATRKACGVANQAARDLLALPPHLARWADTLMFDGESTGTDTDFRDTCDPKPRPRRVFTLHQSATLLGALGRRGQDLGA